MALILSLYASVLALAVWQDKHGLDQTGCADKH